MYKRSVTRGIRNRDALLVFCLSGACTTGALLLTAFWLLQRTYHDHAS
jgi:hypothetical protein